MPPRLKTLHCNSIARFYLLLRRNKAFAAASTRSFATTTQQLTRQRRLMFSWLQNHGANFLEPLAGSTNYLGAYDSNGRLNRMKIEEGEDNGKTNMSSLPDSTEDGEGKPLVLPREGPSDLLPFPQNIHFQSQAVASEELREAVWKRVMIDQMSLREVSAQLGVEMSRVGAIVRLKEIEKDWTRTGKPLAKPYADAVMAMLPKSPYPQPYGHPHESINDLPVHAATVQQIFYPTSESRHFTRVDAARVFDESLLPADQRVPHPEMAEGERDKRASISYTERVKKALERSQERQKKKEDADNRRRELQAKALKVVIGTRWDFRFRDISVEDAGPDGRGPRGTGWRYGVPHMDRRRGEIKIPTRVP